MPDIIQHYYESDVYRRGSYSDLTHEIALVRKEIEAADNLFQNASDPDLIDSYIFQGKIVDGIPQGNVFRYGIGCEGGKIHADVLFQETGLLAESTDCWMSIKKEDCILL